MSDGGFGVPPARIARDIADTALPTYFWRTSMADDRKNTGNPDRQRINLSQDYELRDWAKKFGVTADELRAAVHAVGNDADAVGKHLKSSAKQSS
jgi:hypothetical protein